MLLQRLLTPVFFVMCAAGVADDKVPATPPNGPYLLQPTDELTVHSLQVKELADKVVRLDQQGDVNLPLVGHLHLAGLSVAQAEGEVASRVKKFYVDPDVQLSVAAMHTEPYSVVGSVGTPGLHEMKTRMTLAEAISTSGGLRPDAGPVAIVTRDASAGPIPYAEAHVNSAGQSVAEVQLSSLFQGSNPKENFVVQPHDMISIPAAQVVYVVGNVKRSGGFSLNGKSDFSVLQALAMAEGLDPRAAPQRAKILRRSVVPEKQIPVDLKRILSGKDEDLSLMPNDILFVPSSTMKVVTTRTIEAAIQIGTGILVFH
jgi:polysaccharide biosynthesis/export protein